MTLLPENQLLDTPQDYLVPIVTQASVTFALSTTLVLMTLKFNF